MIVYWNHLINPLFIFLLLTGQYQIVPEILFVPSYYFTSYHIYITKIHKG